MTKRNERAREKDWHTLRSKSMHEIPTITNDKDKRKIDWWFFGHDSALLRLYWAGDERKKCHPLSQMRSLSLSLKFWSSLYLLTVK